MAGEEESRTLSSEVDGRTLALSDGVFAIALTLLVLAIHDPAPKAGQSLGDALADHKGEILSWVWSFAVLAGLWARHRGLFAKLEGLDGRMRQLNLLYLGGIAFVPYPTNVLAKFGADPAAVALYAGTLAFVSAMSGLLVRRGVQKRLFPPAFRNASHADRWWVQSAVMLATIPLSVLVGGWAFLLWFALPRVTPPLD